MKTTKTDPIYLFSDFSFPKQPQRQKKPPPLKINGVAKISSQVVDNGFKVKINNRTFKFSYPKGLWKKFPKIHQKILAQNLAFCATYHLPYLFQSLKKMFYNLPVPLSEAYFFKSFSLSLPSTALMQKTKEKRLTSNLLRRLFDVDYLFSNKKTEIPPYNRTSLLNKAIMPFTFGKDSLLTFALTKELGIKAYPVYIAEPDYPFEEAVKRVLAESFTREFKTKIYFLKNTLGALREHQGWIGWELQLTHYSLMLLPYVYAKRAGFIFFSNEQSCNDTILDEDGFRCNPVYEQSHSWLMQNSLMTSIIGGNSLSIGSLIEPLYEIAIMRILHHRYPDMAKYQSSCDLEEKPKNGGRWCETCSKCGRIYIFLLALGVNPKNLGFKHNLLSLKYRSLYSIFHLKKRKAYGYDQSGAGKDEQIFAFLLAYKRGVKGPLMEEFAQKYLRYALKNENSFSKKFFGIHSHKTIPYGIKNKVLRIFRQELSS